MFAVRAAKAQTGARGVVREEEVTKDSSVAQCFAREGFLGFSRGSERAEILSNPGPEKSVN
jgi:hypothetical protein